jgi:hypothetical protein
MAVDRAVLNWHVVLLDEMAMPNVQMKWYAHVHKVNL